MKNGSQGRKLTRFAKRVKAILERAEEGIDITKVSVGRCGLSYRGPCGVEMSRGSKSEAIFTAQESGVGWHNFHLYSTDTQLAFTLKKARLVRDGLEVRAANGQQ